MLKEARMRSNTIKQFVAMREALVKEKATLEARLAEINEALGVASESAAAPAEPAGRRGRPPAAKKKAAARKKVAAKKKVGRKRGGRGKNKVGLKDTVIQVLREKPMKRAEIVAAVKAAGYKFTTKNPLNSVSAMLYSDKKTFKNNGGTFSVA